MRSLRIFLFTWTLIFTCTSCAAPEVREQTTAESPTVVTSRGELPEALSETVIARALGSTDSGAKKLVHGFLAQAQAPLLAGNHAILLVDGPATFAALRRAIQEAKHHVHIETYIFADDELGQSVADLLLQRRREGIEIRVIYDGIGSVTTPAAFFDRMRAGGIEVLAFKPLTPPNLLPWRANNRDHRKIAVIDGRVAFTGGINISSTYESASSSRPGPEDGVEEGWRDTHIELRGPVATQFQSIFFETWTRAGGHVSPAVDQYFPTLKSVGDELVAAVATEGDNDNEAKIYATYLTAIQLAQERIWLTHAYFAPNKRMREAMVDAAQRGVDVRLIVPSFSDSGLVLNASRASYEELLEGGVRIYEQKHALLHAKTAVFDHALSFVGSANMDMRSFLHNNEVNAVIVGREFALKMETVFERDLRETQEVTRAEWRKRPITDRLKQFASSWFSYWL